MSKWNVKNSNKRSREKCRRFIPRSITSALKCIIISLLYLMTTRFDSSAFLQLVQTELWAHCATFAFRVFFFSSLFFHLFSPSASQQAFSCSWLSFEKYFRSTNITFNLTMGVWRSFRRVNTRGKWCARAFAESKFTALRVDENRVIFYKATLNRNPIFYEALKLEADLYWVLL